MVKSKNNIRTVPSIRTKFVCVCFALVILNSCDFIWTIDRTAKLHNSPSFSCIKSELNSFRDVHNISYKLKSDRNKPHHTLVYLLKPEELHVNVIISISEKKDDYWNFEHSAIVFNRRLNKEQEIEVRKFMKKLEWRIQDNCGLSVVNGEIEDSRQGKNTRP